jgi:hypothetical protein
MFGYVYISVFWIHIPHMRENMWTLFTILNLANFT